MTSTPAYTLTALPWVPWDTARTAPAAEWLWADLDGLHLRTSLPARAPLATHVWGWGLGTWHRWRLQDDQVIGATLADLGTRGTSDGISDGTSGGGVGGSAAVEVTGVQERPAGAPAGGAVVTQVTLERAQTWPASERRVGFTVADGTAADLRGIALTVLRVTSPRPLIFVGR